MENRLYPIRQYTSEDARLIEHFKIYRNAENAFKENKENLTDDEILNVETMLKLSYKSMCNSVRLSVGSSNFMSLGLHKERDEILILEFPRESDIENIDSSYPLKFDENRIPYVQLVEYYDVNDAFGVYGMAYKCENCNKENNFVDYTWDTQKCKNCEHINLMAMKEND